MSKLYTDVECARNRSKPLLYLNQRLVGHHGPKRQQLS